MVDLEGPRRGRKSSRKARLFAFALAAVTVALAGIVLGVSVLAYIEARKPTSAEATDSEGRGNGFRGARVFVDAGCADCHTLATAGAMGTRGPNLDRHFASHEHTFGFVVAQIGNGGLRMPAFRDRLTDQAIRDVATFVLNVAGSDRSQG